MADIVNTRAADFAGHREGVARCRTARPLQDHPELGARKVSSGDRGGLARITLSVLFIGSLIAGSLWILSPFLGAFIWATMIVVATWPILLRLERVFGGRRGAAVAVMSLGLLAILIVPLGVALSTIFGHADELAALFERLPSLALPAAPAATRISLSASSMSNLTAKRLGGAASTPVIGSVPLCCICPMPCAQTTESTLARMMRPGLVLSENSA